MARINLVLFANQAWKNAKRCAPDWQSWLTAVSNAWDRRSIWRTNSDRATHSSLRSTVVHRSIRPRPQVRHQPTWQPTSIHSRVSSTKVSLVQILSCHRSFPPINPSFWNLSRCRVEGLPSRNGPLSFAPIERLDVGSDLRHHGGSQAAIFHRRLFSRPNHSRTGNWTNLFASRPFPILN